MSYHNCAFDIISIRSPPGSSVFRISSTFARLVVAVLPVVTFSAHAQKANSAPVLPSAEQTALKRGQEALQKGDAKRARAEFERAVSLAPNDAAARGALGWILSLQGETDAAITHLNAALKARPDFIQARLTLAEVLVRQGKAAEGEQQARTAIKSAPDNAEAHRTLARILNKRQSDEAVGEMRRAVELGRNRADLRDELGTLLAQRNQYVEAAAAYNEAIRLQADFAQAHFHLGVVRLQQNQLNEAVR